MNMPRRFFYFLLDLIFPWQCVYCRKEVENDYPLCPDCLNQIPIFDDFICPVCQRKMVFNNRVFHQSCRRKTKLEALGAVSSYENAVLKEIILDFKYNKITSLCQPLSFLMIRFLENSFYFSQLPKNNLLIIPLPLHLRKEKQRGFNQSELIAKKVANYFHFPLRSDILLRVINNPAQVAMKNANDRKLNIQGVFQVKNKNLPPFGRQNLFSPCLAGRRGFVRNGDNLKHKTIILIDDVYTTGATMEEAAKILKQNGAKKVIGLVLAKG